ncbi:MAG: hypothetical protein O8C66_07740 [Candidatus Methanoperedens sp.]|nr:hypothetical protein [Candidatus Methanoperedens sp.]MCZ7370387.1 hypothetical protein [Candidatus Methanoperedens sp.]
MRLGTRTVALLLALIVVAAFVVPTTMAKAAKPEKKEKMETKGGGWINSTVPDNKSTFGFEAKNIPDKKGTKIEGNLKYYDHGANIKVKGNVTMLVIDKLAGTATFSGMAKVTDATGAKMMLPYEVIVTAGKKGAGTFMIFIPVLKYKGGDVLMGGHIKVDP